MTAPALARWDDTRARIQAIRAKLPTASTEQLHFAVQGLLAAVEGDLATDGHREASRSHSDTEAYYTLTGEGLCVATLAGGLGIGSEALAEVSP